MKGQPMVMPNGMFGAGPRSRPKLRCRQVQAMRTVACDQLPVARGLYQRRGRGSARRRLRPCSRWPWLEGPGGRHGSWLGLRPPRGGVGWVR